MGVDSLPKHVFGLGHGGGANVGVVDGMMLGNGGKKPAMEAKQHQRRQDKVVAKARRRWSKSK